jgi:Mn2+/Fe2+ NRAMP family transporter
MTKPDVNLEIVIGGLDGQVVSVRNDGNNGLTQRPLSRENELKNRASISNVVKVLTPQSHSPAPEQPALIDGWVRKNQTHSLDEAYSTVSSPDPDANWYKKAFAFSGLGFIICVGYIDPGNWSANFSAGAGFGFELLSMVLLCHFTALFLQLLALKLGIGADRDLAQACRDAYPKGIVITLWVIMETTIAAANIAHLIGSASAMASLFGLPLWAGIIITVGDVAFILMFCIKSIRALEILVAILCLLIPIVYTLLLVFIPPNWTLVAIGLIPNSNYLLNSTFVADAIAILGATVMPHNLFLHSSVIQSRKYPRTTKGKQMAFNYGGWDWGLSSLLVLWGNLAILIIPAMSLFYGPTVYPRVAYLPYLSKLILSALLLSGHHATVIGTLAGQIITEGFFEFPLKPWLRRLLAQTVSIAPAAIVAGVYGSAGAGMLMSISQVILSLALTFAVVPLVHFTSSRNKMGSLVNGWPVRIIATVLVLAIMGINTHYLIRCILLQTFILPAYAGLGIISTSTPSPSPGS